MKKHHLYMGVLSAAVLLALALAVETLRPRADGPALMQGGSGDAHAAHAASLSWLAPAINAAPNQASAPIAVSSAFGPSSVLSDTRYGQFRVDSQGRLVADAHARDIIDLILAVNDREQALNKLAELSQALPAAARKQVVDLFHHYGQYAMALSQAFSPDDVPGTEDAMLQQLDALHTLRAEHFGAEAASGMFGEDEQITRQLIDLMRQQNAPGLSLQQKAELAQQAYDKMPGPAGKVRR